MSKKSTLLVLAAIFQIFISCDKDDKVETSTANIVNEDPASYTEIKSINLGGAGAAEISTYCNITKRLFVVNNSSSSQIDVIDFTDPTTASKVYTINLSSYGGSVNSLSVYSGKLAVAIESTNKTDNGKVVIFNTSTYAQEKIITVGSLPDMVTHSPDGKYILTANEGEPNTDYNIDPEGTISIIDIKNDYQVTTLNFASFASQLNILKSQGFRLGGKNLNFTQDIEPEYITISDDSKKAFVTLQENNAIAEVDLTTKIITKIIPLGSKDFNQTKNSIDVSDKDGVVSFATWNVKGLYMPDAIAYLIHNGTPYLFTANEGDSREYTGFADVKRLGSSSVKLDPTIFPDATTLKTESKLGRLNIVTTEGDKDNDGDIDEIFSLGARSFTIWNASTGTQVWDSNNELDVKANELGIYDDARSDDKSVEPEAVTIGKVGNKTLAFVGLERVDAVAIYDVTNPTSPIFIKMLKTGDAPEGVLFIPAEKSPIGQSLLVVSSENDGNVKIYKANKL